MMLKDSEIMEKLVNNEKKLKQSVYYKPLPFQKGYRVLNGRKPILVSAPHASRTTKNGVVRARENYVGSIVTLLNQTTGVHGIYSVNIIKDPNRTDGGYKKAIMKLIEKKRIKFIIDIHGASEKHDFDIDIGTYNGESLLGDKEIVAILKKSLKNNNFVNISENFFTQNRDIKTVTRFASYHNIPAVQLEIRKKFRFPKHGDDIIYTVKALHEAVLQIEKHLKRKKG